MFVSRQGERSDPPVAVALDAVVLDDPLDPCMVGEFCGRAGLRVKFAPGGGGRGGDGPPTGEQVVQSGSQVVVPRGVQRVPNPELVVDRPAVDDRAGRGEDHRLGGRFHPDCGGQLAVLVVNVPPGGPAGVRLVGGRRVDEQECDALRGVLLLQPGEGRGVLFGDGATGVREGDDKLLARFEVAQSARLAGQVGERHVGHQSTDPGLRGPQDLRPLPDGAGLFIGTLAGAVPERVPLRFVRWDGGDQADNEEDGECSHNGAPPGASPIITRGLAERRGGFFGVRVAPGAALAPGVPIDAAVESVRLVVVLADYMQSGDVREDGPMAGERDALRDWHRLFGLLLTDFFTVCRSRSRSSATCPSNSSSSTWSSSAGAEAGWTSACPTAWMTWPSTTSSRSSRTTRRWMAGRSRS